MGWGYDIHALADGGRLVLGGVRFPDSPRGFAIAGHDGDVVVHATVDAVLGALACGSVEDVLDSEADGGSSLPALGRVRALLSRRSLRVGNLDCTILAAAPRLAGRPAAEIGDNLAAGLGADRDAVAVKAKTNDGIGVLGGFEAIAAVAIVGLEGEE